MGERGVFVLALTLLGCHSLSIVNQQRARIITTRLQLSDSYRPQKISVDTSDFPPPPSSGQGEWSDWDNDSFIGDGSDMGDLFGGDEGDNPAVRSPVQDKGDTTASAGDVDADTVVKRLRAEAAMSRPPFSSVDMDDIPPPPPGSRGEWDQWNGGGSKISSPSSSSSSSSSSWSPRNQEIEETGKSASENWEGWSEDPPYFDEAEVTDDEGNKGFFDDRPKILSLGSSDLWSRVDRGALDEKPASSTTTTTTTEVPVASSEVSSQNRGISGGHGLGGSGGSDFALQVVLEMNRQFTALDTKIAFAGDSRDRKVDQLVTEVADLKRLLTLVLGAVAVLVAKDIF